MHYCMATWDSGQRSAEENSMFPDRDTSDIRVRDYRVATSQVLWAGAAVGPDERCVRVSQSGKKAALQAPRCTRTFGRFDLMKHGRRVSGWRGACRSA
jgi:hypothetical protein